MDLRDNYDAEFQRPIPENYPCLAMQDVFDLSLTWDDLKFLGLVRIQPLEESNGSGSEGTTDGTPPPVCCCRNLWKVAFSHFNPVSLKNSNFVAHSAEISLQEAVVPRSVSVSGAGTALGLRTGASNGTNRTSPASPRSTVMVVAHFSQSQKCSIGLVLLLMETTTFLPASTLFLSASL